MENGRTFPFSAVLAVVIYFLSMITADLVLLGQSTSGFNLKAGV